MCNERNNVLDDIKYYVNKSRYNSKSDKSWIAKMVAVVAIAGITIFALCKYLEPEYKPVEEEETSEK